MAESPEKPDHGDISLDQLFHLFPDDATSEDWFAEQRWPKGPRCPHCGSVKVLSGANHKTMPYRCRAPECRKRFSVRTGTPIECSNLSYQIWAIAIYLMTTSSKGISSMKLHRDLGITQASAWHLAQRLHKALRDDGVDLPYIGPINVDEPSIGGNMRNKTPNTGRGADGKYVVTV